MIVVDTSVLIFALRGNLRPSTALFRHHIERTGILIGDIVLLEMLQGAKSDPHAAFLERELRKFAIVQMLNESIALAAAANYRRLRQVGITMNKTPDLIIGTFCIERDYRLLHDDRDFLPMVDHLGLRIVKPMPQ